jgi:hypothetical protein
MAAISVVEVRIRDLDRFRLFLWELHQLRDEMRVMASPHAERLEHLLDRVDSDDAEDR